MRLFTLSLALLLVCSSSYAPSACFTYPSELTAPLAVLEVIDGDTIRVEYQGTPTAVRLIGVDTPETVHPNKPVQAFGSEASAYLTNLLQGERVWLSLESRTDRYQRLLAYAYRYPDGLFVNLEIIRQGYGFAYTAYPFEYQEDFRTYEALARENGKGLWGDNFSDSSYEIPSTQQTESQLFSLSDSLAESDTVYITKTGKKYHKGSCRHLAKSKIAIKLSEAKKKGYTACKNCF